MESNTDETQASASGALLGWGVFALIAGVVGYMVSAPKMDEIRSGWGQLAAGLDERIASQMQMWQMLHYGSIMAIVIGGLLLLGSIIQQAQKK